MAAQRELRVEAASQPKQTISKVDQVDQVLLGNPAVCAPSTTRHRGGGISTVMGGFLLVLLSSQVGLQPFLTATFVTREMVRHRSRLLPRVVCGWGLYSRRREFVQPRTCKRTHSRCNSLNKTQRRILMPQLALLFIRVSGSPAHSVRHEQMLPSSRCYVAEVRRLGANARRTRGQWCLPPSWSRWPCVRSSSPQPAPGARAAAAACARLRLRWCQPACT